MTFPLAPMRRLMGSLFYALTLVLWPSLVVAQELTPTYYQGFDTGKIEGPVGKAGNALSFDGYGIVNMDRGSMAFFIQSDDEPKTTEWNHVGPFIRTDRDAGYWSMALSFATRREDFLFSLFDASGYAQPIHLPTIFGRWQKGQWHHLAAVWDRRQGITVYEDGKEIASTWGQQRWSMSLLPQVISARAPIDEVYFFDVPLTAAQVAQLAAGQKPTGTPLPPPSDEVVRADGLTRMGWQGQSLANMPRLEPGKPMDFTFARVAGCMDAKRPVAYPHEGLLRSLWPSGKYGPSIRGRRLEIDLDGNPRFDRVRVLAQRGFVGELMTGDDTTELARIDVPDASFWHVKMDQPAEAQRLLLRRRSGAIGQIDFYRVGPGEGAMPSDAVSFTFGESAAFPDTEAGRVMSAMTARQDQRPAQASRQGGAAWAVKAPAFGGFQALGAAPEDRRVYHRARVELVVQGVTKPTPVRVQVMEPVDPERVWLAADVVLDPRGSGAQRYVLTLQGRPVAATPAYRYPKYLGNMRYSDKEFIEIPPMGFALTVESGEPVQWQMGQGGTSLSLIPSADQPAALAKAVDDQVEFMREAYAERMEGHGYSDSRLLTPMIWLAHFAPQRMEFRQMWERVDASKPRIEGLDIAPLAMPKVVNDTGAPDWAFWQMQAVDRIRRHVHWIIDHKQVWTGEFGGVWNDDSTHIENWMGYMLALDGSGKIRRSMRRYWDGVWRYHLVDGVGRYTQDAGHYAEEGTCNLGMRLMVDYGDPVAYARTLLAARRAPQWVEPDPAGGLRWKSFWVGPNGAWVERDFHAPKKAGGHYSDVVVPHGYLIWYNRHPESTKFFDDLDLGGFGFQGTARQMAVNADATRQKLAEELLKPLGRGGASTSGPIVAINEWPVTDEVRKVHQHDYVAPQTIMHYWGSKDTDGHWFDWKISGDDRYLAESYQRVCEWFYSHDWLNSQAQPSMDRCPLPRASVIRSRIGALAANRGTSGNLWPQHAISFEQGGDQIASLVTDNLPNQFAAKLYAFTDQPLQAQLRAWRCNGEFDVTLHRDANDDGVGEEAVWQKRMTLERGSAIDLTLPPRQGVVLAVKPVKVVPVDYTKADPAISASSIEVIYGGHLVVHVYNNGLKPVDDVLVRVRDARSGKIVVSGEQRTGPIAAPTDWTPRFVTVEFKNIDASVWDDMIVEIDPDGKIDDLTRLNNTVRFSHDGRFDLYDEYRPTVVEGRGRTSPAPSGPERALPLVEGDRLAE